MLLSVTRWSALLRVQFPMCMDVHLKWFYVHKISCMKNNNLLRPGSPLLAIFLPQNIDSS